MEYSGYAMQVHIEARMVNLSNKLNEAGFNLVPMRLETREAGA